MLVVVWVRVGWLGWGRVRAVGAVRVGWDNEEALHTTHGP